LELDKAATLAAASKPRNPAIRLVVFTGIRRDLIENRARICDHSFRRKASLAELATGRAQNSRTFPVFQEIRQNSNNAASISYFYVADVDAILGKSWHIADLRCDARKA
jgi:hypothetical protein